MLLNRLMFGVLFVLVGQLAAISNASATEEFYWKNSYGRGVGTAQTLSCGSKVLDAGLCYNACDDGYKGVGPFCWKGLSARNRGVGTAATLGCGSKEYDAGLCYEKCKPGYKGVGPVCWGTPPRGYVDCGAGFAINDAACGIITTGQSISIGMAGAAAMPAATIAANAVKKSQMGQKAAKAAEDLAKLMAPLMEKVGPLFSKAAKNQDSMIDTILKVTAQAQAYFKDPVRAQSIAELVKIAKAGKAGFQITKGPEGAIGALRIIASIIAIEDPTPISGLVASFAYPVYVPGGHAESSGSANAVAANTSIVKEWGYLYGLQPNGDLWVFRLDVGGNFGYSGKIGGGWGGMRIVTAGNAGELFAVAQNGDLYYYKHDSNLGWQVGGKKIGEGWGGMKWVFSGGAVGDERVLYAVDGKGTLHDYRFGGSDVRFLRSNEIGWGWAGFINAFAASNGVVYAVGADGSLSRYQYDLANTKQTPKAQKFGPGWNSFKHVFAGAGGSVYAVDPSGRLFYYRDNGNGGFSGPEKIGEGFDLGSLTAMLKW